MDGDGREAVEGDLLDFSEQEIKIKRADLQIVKIPLTGLSEDDQKFVKGLVYERNRDQGLKTGPYAANITGAFVKVTSKEGLNYQIYGNPKWDPKKRYPLFISLHGSGQSGKRQSGADGWRDGHFHQGRTAGGESLLRARPAVSRLRYRLEQAGR